MTYKVIIHPQAAREAEQAYLYIAERSPQNAVGWYERLIDAMFSLEDFPRRFPIAPENKHFKRDIRHLVVGNYRIIYDVQERPKVVNILHVRHAARRPLDED